MVGIYHEEGDNIHHSSIELSIIDETHGISTNYIIYSHQAKTITRQTPTAEDIYDKYKSMMDRYTKLYNSIDYDMINFKKFRSYTQESPSV